MRKLRCGFFRTNIEVGDKIRAKLEEFTATPHPKDKSRTATLPDGTPVILRNCFRYSDAYVLDFTRIRDIPNQPLSDLEGNEDKLDFSATGKRPAEYTAAIFDPKTGLLIIHEHAYGVTHSMVGKYWIGLLNLTPFRFDPILNQTAADRLMTAGAFSKFSVKLASMGDPAILPKYGLTDNELTELIPFYRSPTISVVLEADPKGKQKSLALQKVKSLANALLPLPRKHLKKLTLVANDEGEKFPIDLLKDRMVFDEPLSAEEAGEVTHEVRYRAVRNAWSGHRTELRKRYPPEPKAST